jgi:YD repeat-containing protein
MSIPDCRFKIRSAANAAITLPLLVCGTPNLSWGQEPDPPTGMQCSNGNPSPNQKCELEIPKTDPTNPTPPIAPVGGDNKALNGTMGDPISISHGYVMRYRTDFGIPVMHGLTLSLTRLYSSTANGITTRNSNGDSLFGPGWYSPYEMCLEFSESEDAAEYVYHDEYGNAFHFLDPSESLTTINSSLVQGPPMQLTKIGTGSSRVYRLRGPGYVEKEFNAAGRLTYIEADYNTQAEERLTFQYDGSGRLYRVNAPSADGRYLLFSFEDTNWPERVTKVSLVAGSSTYDLMRYYADSSGKLSAVRWNPTYYSSSNDAVVIYEYGSMDIVSGVPTFTSGNRLGRESYYLNQESTPRYLSAYYYPSSSASSPTKGFVWDVAATTPGWVQTIALDNTFTNHTPVVYMGDGLPNSTSDPKTSYLLDYKNDIASVTYGNLPGGVKMPPAHIFDTNDNSGSGSGETTPRLPASSKLQDSSFNWYKVWQKTYDLTSSDHLLKFRVLTDSKYTSTSSSSALTTVFDYDSTFKLHVATITNPTFEEVVSNTYGTTSGSEYGRLKTVTKDGLVTTHNYNSAGLVDSIEDPYGNVTDYDYDSRGNVTDVTHPHGNVVTRTYNDFGQVLTETRTHLGTTTYVYSNATYLSDGTTIVPSIEKYLPPRLIEVKNAQNAKTRYFYTPDGQSWKVTDSNGKTTENTYDRRGRLTEVENHAGEIVQYSYDVYDRMTSFTDGRGKETLYEYDPFGRVTKETDPDANYKEYVYSDGSNPGGCGCGSGGARNVERIRQEDGKYIHFSYDVAGRMQHVWYSSNGTLTSTELANPQVTYDYDAASRIAVITDTRLTTSGNSYSFTFDTGNTGRLEKVTHPEGYTQEYIYQDDDQEDHYRRLIAYRDVDGHIVNYDYDSLERLSTLTDGYGADTVYTYATTSDTTFPVGAVKRTVYGNNAKNDFTFDSLGRLDKVEHLNAGSSVFDYVDLTYDPAGMITEKKRKDGGSYFTTFYTYDDAYRLIEELTKNSSGVEKTVRTYGYDDAGNRTSMAFDNDSITTKSTTYSYGNRNQITSNTGYYRDGSIRRAVRLEECPRIPRVRRGSLLHRHRILRRGTRGDGLLGNGHRLEHHWEAHVRDLGEGDRRRCVGVHLRQVHGQQLLRTCLSGYDRS